MRPRTASLAIPLVAALAVLGAARISSANKLDLALSRFVECQTPTACTPRIAEYERFMAEYAFGISPKLLSPASTLGYSGFYMGLEGSLTPVPDGGDNDRWHDGTAKRNYSPGVMFFPAVRIRKGLPWSFEIGSSIHYLAQSELVGLGGEVKWSIFEGFRHEWKGALPDLAARGSVIRVLGESDVDMTILGLDGTLSYTFGAGGVVSLSPYLGFQYLWTFVRLEPLVYIDERPGGHEEWQSDENELHRPVTVESAEGYFYKYYDTKGLSGPNLERMKLFLGMQLKYELLSIIFDLGWGLPSEWDTAIYRPSDNASDSLKEAYNEQRAAEVGHQITISLAVGLDF